MIQIELYLNDVLKFATLNDGLTALWKTFEFVHQWQFKSSFGKIHGGD